MLAPVRYEPNPKHKEPWQRGARGSLCPAHVDQSQAQKLLLTSIEVAGKGRFGTDGATAFQAQRHAADAWHGYPVGWKEVPEPVRSRWISEGVVRRRDVKRRWDDPLRRP